MALAAVQAVLIPLFGVLCDMPLLASPAALFLVAALGNIGIAAVGTLLSALAARIGRENLLVILVLPLVIPVLVAAAEASRLVTERDFGPAWWHWIQLLARIWHHLRHGRHRAVRICDGGVARVDRPAASGSDRDALLPTAAERARRSPPSWRSASWLRVKPRMGEAQRIVYIHVAVAWFGLVGLIGSCDLRTALPAETTTSRGIIGPKLSPKSAGCVPASRWSPDPCGRTPPGAPGGRGNHD